MWTRLRRGWLAACEVRKGKTHEVRWSVVSMVQVSWVHTEQARGGLRAKMVRRPDARVACRASEAWAEV